MLAERRPEEIAAESERMRRMAAKNRDVYIHNRNRVGVRRQKRRLDAPGCDIGICCVSSLKLSCCLFGWQRLEPLVAVVAAEQVVRVREADFLLLHYYLLFKKTDLVRGQPASQRAGHQRPGAGRTLGHGRMLVVLKVCVWTCWDACRPASGCGRG